MWFGGFARRPTRGIEPVAEVATLLSARGPAFLADEPGDRVEPRTETSAVGQTVSHAEGAQEGLLHGVLSVLTRARSCFVAAQRKDQRCVSVIDPSARFPVTGIERGEVRAVIVHGPANAIHGGVVSEIDGIR